MKHRPKVLWLAESRTDGAILKDEDGSVLVDPNRAELKDRVNDLYPSDTRTPSFKLVKFRRVE